MFCLPKLLLYNIANSKIYESSFTQNLKLFVLTALPERNAVVCYLGSPATAFSASNLCRQKYSNKRKNICIMVYKAQEAKHKPTPGLYFCANWGN